MTAVLIVVSSNAVVGVVGVVGSGVDTDLDPGEQTVLDAVTEVEELREWVVGAGGLLDTPHIVGIAGDFLGVGGVGVGVLYGGAQDLVPEELADVGDAASAHLKGAVVAVDGGVEVSQQVGVDGTAVVVTREDGLEGDNTVLIGLLDTTKVGRVQAVGGVVATGGDTTTYLAMVRYKMRKEPYL